MNEKRQSSSTTKKRKKILPSSSTTMKSKEDNGGEDDERKLCSRPRHHVTYGERNISNPGDGNKRKSNDEAKADEDQDQDQHRPRRRRKIDSTTTKVDVGRLKKNDSDRSSSTNDVHNDGSEEGTFSSSFDHEHHYPGGAAEAAISAGRTSAENENCQDHDDRNVAQSRPSVRHHHRRQLNHGRTASSSQSPSHSRKNPPILMTIEEAQKRIKRLSHEELIDASRRALQLHLQRQFLKQTKENTDAAAGTSAVAASTSLSQPENQRGGTAGGAALSSSRASSDKPSDEEGDQMNKKISGTRLQIEGEAKTDSCNTYKTEFKVPTFPFAGKDKEDPVPTVEQLETQARLQEKALDLSRENPSLSQALLHLAALTSGMNQSPFYDPDLVQQAANALTMGQTKKENFTGKSTDASAANQIPQTVNAKVRPEDIFASAKAVAAAGPDGGGDSNGSRGEGSGSGGSGSNDQKTTSGALSSLSSSVMYRSKEETTSSSSGDDHNHKKKKEEGSSGNKKRNKAAGDIPSDTCYNSNEGRLSSLTSSKDNANRFEAVGGAQDSKLSPQDAGKERTFIDASGGASLPMSGLSASNSDPSGSTGSSDDKKPSATKNESHAHAEEGSADDDHNHHKHRTSNLEGHLNRQGRKIAFKEIQGRGMHDDGTNKDDYGKQNQESSELLGEESVSSGVTSEDGGVSSSLSGSSNTNKDHQPSVSSDQAVCSRSSGSSGQEKQLKQNHHTRRSHTRRHASTNPSQRAVAFEVASRGKLKRDKASSASTEQQLSQDCYKLEWEQMLGERPESSNVKGITDWLLRLFDLATLSQAASEAGIAVTNSTRSSSNDGDGDTFRDEVARARNSGDDSSGGTPSSKDVAKDGNVNRSEAVAVGHSHQMKQETPNSSHPQEKSFMKRINTKKEQ